MIYIVHIPNKTERITIAAEVQKILHIYKEFIPGKENGIYDCDIGIKSTVNKSQLKQILGLIKRRGYNYQKRESRADSAITL